MEFLKKNYEKVLLAVVLLGLTLAACALPFIIQAKRDALEAKVVTTTKIKKKPIAELEMSVFNSALLRAQSPFRLDYTTKHNLFNPVLWKRLSDGRILKEQKGNEEGPDALVVTNIKPLYLEIKFGSPSGTGYFISIERQTALREDKRHTQAFVSPGSKGELLGFEGMKGPPDKPTELELVWNETGEKVALPLDADKPYRRVDGYSADLKYPLEANKAWTDKRVGARLVFAGGNYNIVAITESNVVISAESNTKRTTITFHPATEPR